MEVDKIGVGRGGKTIGCSRRETSGVRDIRGCGGSVAGRGGRTP